jgi:hypothetical protein
MTALAWQAITTRRRLRDVLWWSAAAASSTSLGIIVARTGSLAFAHFLLIEIVLVVATIGAVVFSARTLRDGLNPLALTALFYALAFGAGGMYFWFTSQGRLGGAIYDHRSLTNALSLATLAFLTLLVGYATHPFRAALSVVPRLPSRVSSYSIPGTVVGLLLLGWPARIMQVANGRDFHTIPSGTLESSNSQWFVQAFASLPVLALAFLGAYGQTSEGRRSRRLRVAFWSLFLVELAWLIPSGDRGRIIGLAVMLVVIRYYGTHGLLPWRIIVTCVIVGVFIVLPFGLLYRGDNVHYQLAPSQRLKETSRQFLDSDVGQAVGDGAFATFSRLSDIESLASITWGGRARISQRPGETLLWAPQVFVPRALLSSKADPGLYGNTVARSYQIVSPSDRITAVAVTQPGELWISFGVAGVAVGMAVVGAMYRLFDEYMKRRTREVFPLALYSVIAWPLIIGQESVIAMGIAGLIKQTIFYVLIVLPLLRLRGIASGRESSNEHSFNSEFARPAKRNPGFAESGRVR